MNVFSFREAWNEAASSSKRRKVEPRNYLYASELGGSVYDVYHNLKGREPLTPPNNRSFRKFNAGNLWEWIVKMILFQARALEDEQIKVDVEYKPGRLGVHGRMDFLLSPDKYDPSKIEIPGDLPDFLELFIKNLEPQRFSRCVFECKSIGSYIFPTRERKPAVNHVLQTFHYCREKKLPGMIVYISKDDCLVAEHYLLPNSVEWDLTEKAYNDFIAKVSKYYEADEVPPLEPLILKEDNRFKKNWHVEYSKFLPDYGFETPEEYRDAVDGKISRWNRVLKRIEDGDKMTDNNKEAIKEMKAEGFKI